MLFYLVEERMTWKKIKEKKIKGIKSTNGERNGNNMKTIT
jgi:hypothetical protein